MSVLLGVMVLTIVLAVMTGFEEDLRSRILGLNPHVRLVDRLSGGSIRDPGKFAAAVAEHPDVLGAAPVVTAQMLVAANGRLMGVIGRGVATTGDSIAIGILDFVVEGAAADLGV
ncbi:MAG: lipoprotein-releasing system transmembrane subunit LolC, partial [Myxococcales bacterium]